MKLFIFTLITFAVCWHCAAESLDTNTLYLTDGWRIQAAAQTQANSAAVSSKHFDDKGWYSTTVPSTVLGTLVNNGVYRDIFFGTNLAKIPRLQFSNAWWFRDEFNISKSEAADNADLIFEGINYRANIWLNNKLIATTNKIFGAFRIFKLDVSGKFKRGKNVLAVEIFPPQPGDFTMGFVDWNPSPPDRGMGLFRPVKLHFYKAVSLENVFVESKIDHTNGKAPPHGPCGSEKQIRP